MTEGKRQKRYEERLPLRVEPLMKKAIEKIAFSKTTLGKPVTKADVVRGMIEDNQEYKDILTELESSK